MKIKLLSFLLLIFSFSLSAQEVWITGYIDASCPQAKGRTVEIYVSGTVNLSGWNLVRQSNGNGYTSNIAIGELGTLTDQFGYITNDEEVFLNEFDFAGAPIIQTGAINDNGDDAFQLVDQAGNIIDRFGEEGVQPDSNSPWYHKKTYYYRKNGESPNQGNFDANNWIFGDINFLNGKGLCNDSQAYQEIVPFGTFDPFMCEPVSALPYLEDFENTVPPSLHNCTQTDNEGNESNWETAVHNQNGFNGKVLKYVANDQAANAWFFMRGIELEDDVAYQLEFQYGNNDPLSTEKMKVGVGNEASYEAMEILETYSDIDQASAQTGRIYFTPTASGVHYFGFMAFSDAQQNELYLDNIQISEKPNCTAPLNANLEGLTATTAQISWEGEEHSSWKLTYYPLENESDSEEIIVQDNALVTLDDLTPNTTYQVKIQSQCSDNEESQSLDFQFTTLCSPAELPYVLDFEDVSIPSLPDCSLSENGSAGNFWETAALSSNGFNSQGLQYQADTQNPARAWFMTRGVELEAGQLYQISYVYGNDSPNTTEKLKIAYGLSPKATAMDNELADYSAINEAQANAGEHIFEVAEDGIYYFGFLAYSDADQGQLFLDDISIEEAPTCLRPTDLMVDNITANTADLSWEDANDSNAYEVVYGPYGFDPETEGQSISVENEQTVQLSNLEMGTSYEVYVKSICSDQDSSQFSFGAFFITDCEYQDLPYVMDFEQAIVPQLPNCTVGTNLSAGNEWQTYEETELFNSKVLKYDAHYLHSANAWFFTNGVHLEADTNYQVSYTFANSTENTNFFEKLKVAVGNQANAENMEILADHPHISGGEIQTHTVVFSVETEGVYFIGFNAYSNFNASTLYLDDIQIELGPTCPQPADLYYSNLTHESVDFEWISYGSSNSWELAYGTQGFDPDGSNANLISVQDDPQAHLDGLEGSTYYDVYVRALCGNNEFSDWEGPKTFRTKITPPDNNWLCQAVNLEVNQACSGGTYTNVGAFAEPGEPAGACFEYPGKTVWFSFTAPENGEVTLSASFTNTNIVSQITVFETPDDCENPESLGAEVSCAGYGNLLNIPDLNPGSTYYVQVAGNANKEGDFCIEIYTELGLDQLLFEDFTYYPNPVENDLFLKAGFPIEKINLYDLSGRQIKEISPKQLETRLSTEDLNAGMYLLEVHIQGVQKNFKLIKK